MELNLGIWNNSFLSKRLKLKRWRGMSTNWLYFGRKWLSSHRQVNQILRKWSHLNLHHYIFDGFDSTLFQHSVLGIPRKLKGTLAPFSLYIIKATFGIFINLGLSGQQLGWMLDSMLAISSADSILDSASKLSQKLGFPESCMNEL